MVAAAASMLWFCPVEVDDDDGGIGIGDIVSKSDHQGSGVIVKRELMSCC